MEMIKVFLAEDEALLRRGLREGIDWEGNGFIFAGDAGDGEYAYPQILRSKPEILITDVKMPFMDGLELARMVKKALPEIKILILSGHDDFSFVKEGLEIGISDYLLKPITPQKLLEALKKTKESIEEEREKSRLLERYFTSYETYTKFLECTDYAGVDRKVIGSFLRLGAVSETERFIEEYFSAIGSHNYASLLLRQYIAMDIFYCVQRFLADQGERGEEEEGGTRDLRMLLKSMDTVENTKEYLKRLFKAALEKRDEGFANRYGRMIEQAKAYIEENSADEDFSLNKAAAYIGISPSYFSSIFKQETGENFVEYLTKTRIEKACALLRSTKLRTSEVGERVGYGDSHYFSAIFKKIMGKTPKEYRNER